MKYFVFIATVCLFISNAQAQVAPLTVKEARKAVYREGVVIHDVAENKGNVVRPPKEKLIGKDSLWSCSAKCPQVNVEVKKGQSDQSNKTSNSCTSYGSSAIDAARKLRNFSQSMNGAGACNSCNVMAGDCSSPHQKIIKVSSVLTIDHEGQVNEGQAKAAN